MVQRGFSMEFRKKKSLNVSLNDNGTGCLTTYSSSDNNTVKEPFILWKQKTIIEDGESFHILQRNRSDPFHKRWDFRGPSALQVHTYADRTDGGHYDTAAVRGRV